MHVGVALPRPTRGPVPPMPCAAAVTRSPPKRATVDGQARAAASFRVAEPQSTARRARPAQVGCHCRPASAERRAPQLLAAVEAGLSLSSQGAARRGDCKRPARTVTTLGSGSRPSRGGWPGRTWQDMEGTGDDGRPGGPPTKIFRPQAVFRLGRPGFTALPLYNPTPQAPAAAASLEAVAAIDPKDCGSGRPAVLGTCLCRLGQRRRDGSTGPGTAAGARADDPGP